jgi:hypothetical protein
MQTKSIFMKYVCSITAQFLVRYPRDLAMCCRFTAAIMTSLQAAAHKYRERRTFTSVSGVNLPLCEDAYLHTGCYDNVAGDHMCQ